MSVYATWFVWEICFGWRTFPPGIDGVDGVLQIIFLVLEIFHPGRSGVGGRRNKSVPLKVVRKQRLSRAAAATAGSTCYGRIGLL